MGHRYTDTDLQPGERPFRAHPECIRLLLENVYQRSYPVLNGNGEKEGMARAQVFIRGTLYAHCRSGFAENKYHRNITKALAHTRRAVNIDMTSIQN